MAFHEPYYTTQSSPKLAQYFKQHLEGLFYANAVDIVVNGHIHAYERSYPVYNNVVSVVAWSSKKRLSDGTCAAKQTWTSRAVATSWAPENSGLGLLGSVSVRCVALEVAVCSNGGWCVVTGPAAHECRWTNARRSTSSSVTAATRRVRATTRARRTRCAILNNAPRIDAAILPRPQTAW